MSAEFRESGVHFPYPENWTPQRDDLDPASR